MEHLRPPPFPLLPASGVLFQQPGHGRTSWEHLLATRKGGCPSGMQVLSDGGGESYSQAGVRPGHEERALQALRTSLEMLHARLTSDGWSCWGRPLRGGQQLWPHRHCSSPPSIALFRSWSRRTTCITTADGPADQTWRLHLSGTGSASQLTIHGSHRHRSRCCWACQSH